MPGGFTHKIPERSTKVFVIVAAGSAVPNILSGPSTAALMTPSLQFSRSFVGGSISTAASPRGSSFVNISCRSPRTPRDADVGRSRNGLLNSPLLATQRISPASPTFRETRTAYNGFSGSRSVVNFRPSITLASPSVTSSFLPQTSVLLCPSTPNNLSSEGLDDGKIGTISAINLIVGKTIGVGVYSVPSSIFAGVGSVGMSILMWILGSVISFCGLAVYLELGCAMPRSGGERVYLERIFRRPAMLASCMFGAYVVLLGFSTPNCIILGEYIMYALGVDVKPWNVRSVAVGIITLLCLVHAQYPRLGLRIINVLGASKMLILVIVIASGISGMVKGIGRVSASTHHHAHFPPIDGVSNVTMSNYSTAQRNFTYIWAGSSTQPYDYATALLKVLYCFRGYSTCNQVLSSVRRPVRTLQVAAPIALGLVSASYIAANIAYFLAVEKDDFRTSGVVIAGHFFRNVFGVALGERILPCFIVVSAFGNIAATSFAQARVNEELGKDGLLPFANFWRDEVGGKPPIKGLFLHWLISVLVIVVPPPGSIYNFLVDIGGYPISVISVAIALGLLYLQSVPSENWVSSFHARKVYTVVFATSNIFLLIFPWIKPHSGLGDSGRFPYYAYPATALGILASGALYWVWWACFRSGTGRMNENGSSNRARGHPGILLGNEERLSMRHKDRVTERHENSSNDRREEEELMAHVEEDG